MVFNPAVAVAVLLRLAKDRVGKEVEVAADIQGAVLEVGCIDLK
jgi:hypothetical protein